METSTLILTQREIERLADTRTAIRAVREAFLAQARGETLMPPKVYLQLAEGDFRAMPAAIMSQSAAGLKWVNVHPRNPKRGLPSVMAVMLLNDPATGRPLAVMDGLLITKLRTAAAAAVAADCLARPDSRIVALIGCGAQADAQMTALAQVRKIQTVRVWGFLKGEADAFCRKMAGVLKKIEWQSVASIEQAVKGSDIVTTLTPSRQPIVDNRWIAPGAHINAVGADGPGKQELDPAILRRAVVIVDEREQSIHGGEINVPVTLGQFRADAIQASLGEVLLGKKPGRRKKEDITVFDSTGLAIHDVALAQVIYRAALGRRVGRRIRLFQ